MFKNKISIGKKNLHIFDLHFANVYSRLVTAGVDRKIKKITKVKGEFMNKIYKKKKHKQISSKIKTNNNNNTL